MYTLISVCMPVYHAVQYLASAIESVQQQSWRAWELICVEDGSKDDSQTLIAEKIREDGRIRMICQRNGGISRARNRALDHLRGDAFMHMDQDDLYAPYALEVLAQTAEKEHCALVLGHMREFAEEHLTFPARIEGSKRLEGAAWRALTLALIRQPYVDDLEFSAWNKLYDRATFGALRFLPERYGDDTYYMPKTHLAVTEGAIAEATTYFWRRGHVSGSSQTCHATWLQGYMRSLCAALTLDSGKDYAKAWENVFKWIFLTALHAATTGTDAHRTPAFRAALSETLPMVFRTPIRVSFRRRCILRCLQWKWYRLAFMLFLSHKKQRKRTFADPL